MLKKIGNGFIGFMCFLLIIILAMLLSSDSSMGGLGLNGFAAFLAWVGYMVIFVWISPQMSVVVAFIVYMIIWGISGVSMDVWVDMAIFVAVCAVVILWIRRRDKIDKDVDDLLQKGVVSCPRCGRADAVKFIQPRQEFVKDDEEYYDPYEQEYKYRRGLRPINIEGHYWCMRCGKKFTPRWW